MFPSRHTVQRTKIDRVLLRVHEEEKEEKEKKKKKKKKKKKPMLSVPYKLINLGANNCLGSFRESQIGGVDLAVFRGHAFSTTIRQCVCPIGQASSHYPRERIVPVDVPRVCPYLCKLFVTNWSW